MLRNTSIATIDSPEFIQVTPQNDLISKCEIKVLYLGENRNHSFITKDVAKQMANSLPGMPIVAAYLQDKEDFSDHGHVVTIEDGEVKFTCKTVPYGFVAPDAEIWFQKFLDTDSFGEQVEREYLMTTGYLWTGQYPEVQKVIDEGMPQSMELDEATLDGHWATNGNSGVEFFIINDATFSKLCILGSDVEPCFEGSSVTAPSISKEFSAEPEFVRTLLAMRDELNYALQNEGGSDMLKEEEVVEEPVITEFDEAAADSDSDSAGESGESSESAADADAGAEETPEASADEESEPAASEEPAAEESSEEESEQPESLIDLGDGAPMKKQPVFTQEDEGQEALEYANDDKKKDEESDSDASSSDSESSDDSADNSGEDAEDDKKKKNPPTENSLEEVEAEFAAAKAELESVKAELAAANAELESLREFKLGIENSKKDELIAKYHMLSDEAKAEISEHKEEYSLSEIESKLAVAYVNEFADFESVDGKASEEVEDTDPITTFSLDGAVEMTGATGFVADLLAARNK